MDTCHAPDRPSLDAMHTVTSEAVLRQYHNGPTWSRICSIKREAESGSFVPYAVPKEEDIEDETDMKLQEDTKQIIELAKSGSTIDTIVKATGYGKKKVKNAVFRARKTGAIQPPSAQAESPMAKPDMLIANAYIVPPALAPDLSSIHAMIDLAAKLPALRTSILTACDEIEKAAQYQLYSVNMIREVLNNEN